MQRMNYTRLSSEENYDEFKKTFGEIVSFPLKLSGGGRQQETKIIMFIYAELLMFTAYKIYNREFSIDELLTLFSGVHTNYINIDESQDKFIIHAHTFLSSHADEWDKRSIITHFYFKQRDHNTKQIQLFKSDTNLLKDKNAKIFYNSEVYAFKEREEKYEKVLSNHIYIRLIDNYGKNVDPILTDYLEYRISEKQGYDVYKKANDALESINYKYVELIGKHYPEVYKLIKLKEITKQTSHVCHIAGKTGHGKSVLFDIYIKKLTDAGLKVLYVTDTHAPNSIKVKNRLDSIGIKTTIIMGKERAVHIDKFIYSEEGKSIPELIVQYRDLFSNIDFTCYSSKVLNCRKCDFKSNEYRCGFYDMYKRLPASQVVITTPYNLLDSVANVRIDKYRRSIYEILNIWADVILFDEADKLQVIGDDRLVSEVEVYSLDTIERSNKEHLEGLLKVLYQGITRRNIVENERVKKFKTIVNRYDREVDLMHILFFNQEGKGLIRKNYGGKNFTLRQLIEDWSTNYISSVICENGLNLDLSQFTNRFFALLTYRINSIRTNYIEYLIEKYEYGDIEIPKIFNEIFNRYKREVCTVELTNDELEDFLFKGDDIKGKTIKVIFKHLSQEMKLERNEMITYILLLGSIDQYLKRIYDIIRPILDILSSDHNYISIATSTENHLMAPKAMIKDGDGFRIDNSKDGIKLIKNIYHGIGREILFENPRAVARIYDFQPPCMILTSATASGTESSRYTIKYPVNQLLKREGTENSKITLKCHVFYKKGEPICISGIDFYDQNSSLRDLTSEIYVRLLKPLLHHNSTGVLISTSSYINAKTIFDELVKLGANTKVIYHESMGEYNTDVHVLKLDIERKAGKADIFIGVNIIMERGFNIIDGEGKSLFRDIVIMNRALPSPKDVLEKVSYFHKELNKPSPPLSFRDIKYNMYKTHKALRYFKGFRKAPKYIKESIAGNTLVSLKQLSGRGQRGGTDVIIHIADAAFYPMTAEKSRTEYLDKIIDSKEESLLIAWRDMINNGGEVTDILYDDLKNALNNYELVLHKD